MAEHNTLQVPPETLGAIEHHLAYLKLSFIAEQYAMLAKQAADKAWSHVDYSAAASCGHHHHRRQELPDERSTRELTLTSSGPAGRQPCDSGELLPPCTCRIFTQPTPQRASHIFKEPIVLHFHATDDNEQGLLP